MKKIFSILIALLALASIFASCNASDTDTSTDTSTDTATDTAANTNTGTNATADELNGGKTEANLTVAEKRKSKVSFNIKVDIFASGLVENESDENSIAIMGENADGNEYIEYAPNVYKYHVLITCDGTLLDAWEVVKQQKRAYFEQEQGTDIIDAEVICENMLMVYFPDFSSFALCQENMLNALSALDTVSSIKVGCYDAQNGATELKNVHEYVDVDYHCMNSTYLSYENEYISSYEELALLVGNRLEQNEELQQITEQTFEDNYVFFVVNQHYRGYLISDAKLIGNTVYFTTNKFKLNRELIDAMVYVNTRIVLVPKSELGELPQDVTVKDIEVYVFKEWGEAD